MKLTPEQKVFIEYGKAKKALEIAKKQLAKEMRRYLSRHQARDYNNIDILIRDVWRKRAACRAWIQPQQRGCFTCKHDGTHYKLCALCHGKGWPVSWEPRKENKN